MPLPSGTRLGSYEVVDALGHGGMGEVYRAHDATLRRDVAIKVVAARQLGDGDGVARFEREARLLAALNHPNIASIYGVVNADGIRGLVMELVDGPTLKEIIEGLRHQATGPRSGTSSSQPGPWAQGLGPDKVLALARQLIDALEAAHDKGIVHRDLKPANIKLTSAGAVKVLDFGIAKALTPSAHDTAEATTIERTEEGTVLGTAAYMSPEQARGQVVDERADIWAFGAILYELLTRRKAFTGGTTTDVLASVLTMQPDWTAIPSDIPPGVVRLLRRCLEKDPARRLRHIGDARFDLDDAVAAPVVAAPTPRVKSRRAWLLWAALAALGTIVLADVLLRTLRRSTPATAAAIVTGMAEPPGESLYLFSGPIAVSPDGTRVVFVTNSRDGKPRLWLKGLGESTPVPLAGGEGGLFPFWSPDGRSIGFFAEEQLKVLDLGSGAVKTLAPNPGPLGGGTWNRDGTIVFAGVKSGLKRIPATGGEAKEITKLDAARGDGMHVFPSFLPDGRHFVFFVTNPKPGESREMLGTLDSADTTPLLPLPTAPIYAEPGYLLYARGSELMAQRFDPIRLTPEGDPVVLRDKVWTWGSGPSRAFSASATGLLIFATRKSVTTHLSWFDRNGRPGGEIGEPGEWVHVAVSPDERTVAAERMDPRTGDGTVWMIDVARNVTSRLTSDPSWTLTPVWSPDSRRIAFASSRDGGSSDLYVRAADGSGADELLLKTTKVKVPIDWVDDRLIFNSGMGTNSGIWTMPVARDPQATPFLDGASNESYGKISPDGRWLAYVSDESSRPEVYVRSLTGTSRVQISRSGGGQPRWRRDGKELYFVTADSRLMAVGTTPGAAFAAGEPIDLHISAPPDNTNWRYTYDVVALGQRFLVSRPAAVDPTPPISVVVNWTSLLKK